MLLISVNRSGRPGVSGLWASRSVGVACLLGRLHAHASISVQRNTSRRVCLHSFAAWMRTATARPRPELGLAFPRGAPERIPQQLPVRSLDLHQVSMWPRVAVDCLYARHQRPVCEETVESIAGCWDHHQAQSGSAPSTTTWSRLSLLNI